MRYLAIALFALFFALPAQAAFEGGQNTGSGGFSGPGADFQNCTVQQAKSMRDDSFVTLTGSIVSQIDDDDYIFRDNTGEIRVDIDRKYMPAETITPQTRLRISGEVDKDFGKVEIDVKRVEIVK